MAALWLAIGVCFASAAAVVKTIKVGRGALGVSSDGTHVWVTNYGGAESGDTVSEIDASTGTVVKTIKVGTDPFGVSSDGTHVWVATRAVRSVRSTRRPAAWFKPSATADRPRVCRRTAPTCGSPTTASMR